MVARVSCIIVFAVAFSCDEKTTTASKSSQVALDPPIEVQTTVSKIAPFESHVLVNGKVHPNKMIILRARVTGVIKELNFYEGKTVQAGDLLFEMENDKYLLQLEKQHVLLQERTIDYEEKLMSYDKKDSMFQKHIKRNLEYLSGLSTAQVQFKEAKLALDFTKILSPISGIVADVKVKVGNYVQEGEVICTVFDPHSLVVSCELLESNALLISKDAKAEIRAAFSSSKAYFGQLLTKNPIIDPNTGLMKVTFNVSNTGDLLPGMTVVVIIQLPSNETLVIPKTAIVIRSGKEVVFTEENGKAKWNYVTTGRSNSENVEITSGLQENETVIVTNNLQLAHDSPIKVLTNLQ